ncbi:hemerythrin domain-containing protein [Paenibacillus frigoriresistens]|uniref:hemerythrin domain-containing protein n=1 Tax=Paenibacillus alginolyticus TaxID=59839 RepID=UPI00156586BF|nr:hemerythrin domain-containing protein [Paenibacillus frigoriresistens]NRF95800.1 hemerythrin domain-containing protein [Paenibacillus frigoriresistens]
MVVDLGMSLEDARTFSLQQILERLKDEHSALKKELDHVQEMTSHMVGVLGSEESKWLLQEISKQMEAFMQQLEAHEHWEEDEVLPLLAGYVNQGVEPTFLTSTWVLEEDHKQAERFVRSFLEYADQCKGADSIKLKKAISLLSVACSVLSEHLLSEEEMFFPVANQMLSNIQAKA